VPADRPDAPTLDHAAAVFADVRVRVTRFITGFAQSFWTDTTITWVEANRQECFLVSRGRHSGGPGERGGYGRRDRVGDVDDESGKTGPDFSAASAAFQRLIRHLK